MVQGPWHIITTVNSLVLTDLENPANNRTLAVIRQTNTHLVAVMTGFSVLSWLPSRSYITVSVKLCTDSGGGVCPFNASQGLDDIAFSSGFSGTVSIVYPFDVFSSGDFNFKMSGIGLGRFKNISSPFCAVGAITPHIYPGHLDFHDGDMVTCRGNIPGAVGIGISSVIMNVTITLGNGFTPFVVGSADFSLREITVLSVIPQRFPANFPVSVFVSLANITKNVPRYMSIAVPGRCNSSRLISDVQIFSESVVLSIPALQSYPALAFCYLIGLNSSNESWREISEVLLSAFAHGNGIIEPPESCDDGNNVDGDCCSSSGATELRCSCETSFQPSKCYRCGDSRIVIPMETCDDGNLISNDGCSSTCQTELGYTCNMVTGGANSCGKCGNALQETTEKCDDGNLVAGDGCNPSCEIELGYTCVGGIGVKSRCAFCGNSILESGEECDDVNTKNGDGCSSTCTLEPGFFCYGILCQKCGNGIIEGRENCDDGNQISGDGCSNVLYYFSHVNSFCWLYSHFEMTM